MDLDEIKKIVELMDEHGLSQFKLEQDDTKLELKKAGLEVAAIPQMAQMPVAQAPAPASAGGDPASSEDDGGPGADEADITAPTVGTFYLAPDPDSPPFVEIGSDIEESSVVCIIEAMKVMNEIHADVRGKITSIHVENGTPVQYGDPLFRVKKG